MAGDHARSTLNRGVDRFPTNAAGGWKAMALIHPRPSLPEGGRQHGHLRSRPRWREHQVDSPDTPGWLGYWLSDQGTVNLSIAEHSVSGNLTAHLTGQANTYTHLALSGSWACSY